MNNKGNFLMRRIEYTPDNVNIYCDIRIKWLQEIYFYSILKMPNILFDMEEFKKYKIEDTYISLDIEEWTEFQKNIISIFRNNDNLRNKVINNVKKYLNTSQSFIDGLYNEVYKQGKLPKSKDVEKMLNLFIDMDTFAVFNMFIPYDYYKQLLMKNKIDCNEYSVDDLMICTFEPHRMLVSRSKLELIRDYLINREVTDKEYLNEIAAYEEFENWIFDNIKLKDTSFLMREVKNVAKKYSLREIEEQLNWNEKNRLKQLSKYKKLLDELKNSLEQNNYGEKSARNVLNSVGLLSVIVSEEEKRHMIECKIFAILAEIFNKIKIDPARTSLKRIYKNYCYMEENYE